MQEEGGAKRKPWGSFRPSISGKRAPLKWTGKTRKTGRGTEKKKTRGGRGTKKKKKLLKANVGGWHFRRPEESVQTGKKKASTGKKNLVEKFQRT